MKLFLLSLIVVAFVAASVSAEPEFEEFQRWTHKFNKVYADQHEYLQAFKNFLRTADRVGKKNVEHAAAHGAGRTPFGLNKFADLSPEEFRARYLNFVPNNDIDRSEIPVVYPMSSLQVPDHKDWRHHGAVTAVKDQGQCGSCWAFSATEEVESMNALNGTVGLQVLAPQQVVSCDNGDGGCNGGDTISAYAYIKKVGGITSERNYPYTSGTSGNTGQCEWNGGDIIAGLSTYTYATPGCYDSCDNQDEDLLKKNVASTGPASICVNAESWQDYWGGVMSSGCGAHDYSSLDHCVQLVGYNTNADGTAYWLVRNSWNTDWGEEGYIYLEMGSNMCGVADEATFIFP